MSSSDTIERRRMRDQHPDGALLRKLENRKGAFYIDFENQCPLTHTSHRVGRNYKLCSPITPEGPPSQSQGECNTKRMYPRPSRRGVYSQYSNRYPSTTSPYDEKHYNYHL